MASQTGPYLDRTGLVFYYDTRNTNESFKGRPTTNVVSGNYDVTFESTAIGNTSGFNNQLGTGNYLGVSNNYGYRSNKSLRVNRGTGGTGRVYRTYSVTAGEYSTVSAWVYSESSGPYLTIEYFGGDYSWGVSQARNYHGGTGWERLFVRTTVAATSNTTGYYFLYPSVQNTDTYWDNIQVEKQAYATPFVNGTRSSTESVKDIIGTYSVDVSNVSFDSSGNIDFDGTNDDLRFASDQVIKTTGGWTVESLVKYDSVAGGYNNVTSPANFIGSDSIVYNSWYWSVLNNKLALWNRSPGTWRYGSTTIQPNTWYHTALVCYDSGTQYQMYLNGVAEGGDHTTYSWNASYAGLRVRYIGRGNGSNVRLVNGQIPMTRIYNRALSADEVAVNASMFKSLTG